MIYLAYDGSLNGDWISWYAIRMASRSPQKELVLVHVLDGKIPAEQIEVKIKALEARCRGQQVQLISNMIPPLNQNVFQSLMRFIPEGEKTICVCGTRARSRPKGFLAGTISAKFLQHHKFCVLAIRVVQPGIFGNAKQFLLPLAGHPRKLKSLSPFLRLFPPDIQDVYLLRIMAVSAFRFRHLSSEQRRSLLIKGRSYLSEAAAEIAREVASPSFYLDTRVVVSDDWPGEILMHANHLKVQMILLGASERTLPARFLYYENALERILTRTPCDMGIYRSV